MLLLGVSSGLSDSATPGSDLEQSDIARPVAAGNQIELQPISDSKARCNEFMIPSSMVYCLTQIQIGVSPYMASLIPQTRERAQS